MTLGGQSTVNIGIIIRQFNNYKQKISYLLCIKDYVSCSCSGSKHYFNFLIVSFELFRDIVSHIACLSAFYICRIKIVWFVSPWLDSLQGPPLSGRPAPLPAPVLAVVRLGGGVGVGRQPRPQQTRRDRAVVKIIATWTRKDENILTSLNITHVSPRL